MENQKQSSIWTDVIILIVGVLVFLGTLFLAFHSAHAEASNYQTGAGNSAYVVRLFASTSNCTGADYNVCATAQYFTPSNDTNIASTTMNVGKINGSNDGHYLLLDIQTDNSGQPSGVSVASSTFLATNLTTYNQSGNANNNLITFSSWTTNGQVLHGGTTYWAVLSFLDSYNADYVEVGGTPTNGAFSFHYAKQNSTFYQPGVDGTASNYMDLEGGAVSETIGFFNPYPTSTPIKDFSTWTVSIGSQQSCNYQVKVLYDYNSSSTFSYQDSANVYTCGLISGLSYIPKTHPLWFFPLNATTTWYAKAYLYNASGTYLSQSLLDTFVISVNSTNTSPFGGLPYVPAVSSTSFFATEDCSVYNGNLFSSSTLKGIGCQITNIVMNTLQFLFVPSQDVSGYLSDALRTLETRFPFSLVFGIVNSVRVGASDVSSSTPQSVSFDVPQVGLHSTFLTPTTLEDAVGSSTKNLFFSATRMIIWVGTGVKLVSLIL